jgi:hypothetical protein
MEQLPDFDPRAKKTTDFKKKRHFDEFTKKLTIWKK